MHTNAYKRTKSRAASCSLSDPPGPELPVAGCETSRKGRPSAAPPAPVTSRCRPICKRSSRSVRRRREDGQRTLSPFYSMPGELARLLNRVALAAVDNGTSVNGEQGEGK